MHAGGSLSFVVDLRHGRRKIIVMYIVAYGVHRNVLLSFLVRTRTHTRPNTRIPFIV